MQMCYHDYKALLDGLADIKTLVLAQNARLASIEGDLSTTKVVVMQVQQFLGEVMSPQLKALQDAVAAEKTIADSAIALLNGLSAQIAAIKDDPVALQALADSLSSENEALSSAVTANTPAAP